MSILSGIWTQWSVVLCYKCHGRKLPGIGEVDVRSQRWVERITPRPLQEGNDITHCDHCGCRIQVDEELALEHNVATAMQHLGYAVELLQVGGMASAVQVELKSEFTLLCSYNLNCDNMWEISTYDDNGEWVEFSEVHVDRDKIINHLLNQKGDIKRARRKSPKAKEAMG